MQLSGSIPYSDMYGSWTMKLTHGCYIFHGCCCSISFPDACDIPWCICFVTYEYIANAYSSSGRILWILLSWVKAVWLDQIYCLQSFVFLSSLGFSWKWGRVGRLRNQHKTGFIFHPAPTYFIYNVCTYVMYVYCHYYFTFCMLMLRKLLEMTIRNFFIDWIFSLFCWCLHRAFHKLGDSHEHGITLGKW